VLASLPLLLSLLLSLLLLLLTTAGKADGTRVCKLCEGDSDSALNMEGVLLGPFLDRLNFAQLNIFFLQFRTFLAFHSNGDAVAIMR
jgi:hypothetical protein